MAGPVRAAECASTAGPVEGLGPDLWIISTRFLASRRLMGASQLHHHYARQCRAKGMSLMPHAPGPAGRGHHRHPWACWRLECCSRLAILSASWTATSVPAFFCRSAPLTVSLPDIKAARHCFGQPPFLVLRSSRGLHRNPPGMGVALTGTFDVFPAKPIFGYKAMVYAMLSIGLLGFMVWGTSTCS